MSRGLSPAAALVVALVASSSSAAAPAQPGLGLTRIAQGFFDPVHVTAPKGGRSDLYVVQRDGRVYLLREGAVTPEVFLDLRRRVGRRGFQGLLSLAFHPRYVSNGRLYVFYVTRGHEIRIEEYRSRSGTVDVRTRRLILRVPQPRSGRFAHYGGQLAFGPDGRLYTAIGDGIENGAQNPGDLYGKLLRLHLGGGSPTVLAYGFRNPWRFSFDRRTGTLYVADVGENRWEEVNLVRWPARPLLNFGWSLFEGRERREDGAVAGRLVLPVAVYGHAAGNCSITGGFVYRGGAVPAARGRYFFGDLCSRRIWTLRAGAGLRTMQPTGLRVPALTSFGEDARGELYLVSGSGTVYRLSER